MLRRNFDRSCFPSISCPNNLLSSRPSVCQIFFPQSTTSSILLAGVLQNDFCASLYDTLSVSAKYRCSPLPNLTFHVHSSSLPAYTLPIFSSYKFFFFGLHVCFQRQYSLSLLFKCQLQNRLPALRTMTASFQLSFESPCSIEFHELCSDEVPRNHFVLLKRTLSYTPTISFYVSPFYCHFHTAIGQVRKILSQNLMVGKRALRTCHVTCVTSCLRKTLCMSELVHKSFISFISSTPHN